MEQSPRPTLVVFEPKWERGDHHPSWCKELVTQLLSLDQDVVALCPKPEELESAVSSRVPEETLKRLTTYRIPDQGQMLGNLGKTPLRMFRVLAMAREYNRHIVLATQNLKRAPECIWFGLTDVFAVRIRGFGRCASRLFTLPYTGLFFFPPSPPRSRIYRIFFDDLGFFRGENCKGIAVLSDRDRSRLLRHYAKPVWTLPDFNAGDPWSSANPEKPGLASDIKTLAGGRKIVLMAGDLSPRKGLLEFLSLAEDCEGRDYFFVVAGTLHEDAFTRADRRKIMSMHNGSNVYIYPHRIESDLEFNAVVSQAAVLYAVYPDFDHSSNMLIQAAVNEIPIMVASGKEMGLRVDEYELGATVDPRDITAMRNALSRLSEDGFPTTERFRAGCRAYRELHSANRFAREVLRICLTSNSDKS